MKVGSLVLICLLLTIPCQARTITVDCNGPADFNNIQAAINDANDGDEVIVADGLYTGPGNRDIDFGGKSITVRSENGPTNCIIDCNGSPGNPHRAFYIYLSPDACVEGFAITNGYEVCGGGIRSYGYMPSIVNCIFRDNVATDFGGAVYATAKLRNCTFYNNSASYGGGAVGTHECGPIATLENCVVWGNEPNDNPGVTGGGYGSKCAVYTYVYFSVLQCDWKDPNHPEYLVKGSDNIVADPCFADANNNDYHLKSQAGRWDPNSGSWVTDANTSVAIDAGDPADPIGYEPFPNGGIINMGAYGGTAEASKSYFGIPPCETIVAGNINGDCTVNFKDFALMGLHWLEEK